MTNSQEYSSLLLDSGNGWIGSGVQSYLAFKSPEITLCAIERDVILKSEGYSEIIFADPLALLDDYLAKGYIAVGYIGYEYSRWTVDGFAPSGLKEGIKLPDLYLMLYHPEDMLSGDLENIHDDVQLPEINRNNTRMPKPSVPHICSNMSKSQYIDMIIAGKKYIEQGDIYQVNLSQQMTTKFDTDPLEFFLKFHKIQPVPYGSFLDFGDFQVISGSMELFLQKKGNKLTTNPIKGTIKRGITDEIDTILKAKLISSEKERAENLMIVDLMRSDLGRVSMPGSVKVNKLYNVETFNTLHQMVSEVESKVNGNIKTSQIVRSVFPPGSVTGAPKKRTLEVIDELEPHLRGPYCGAIGIFYPEGDFTLSVAIRSMTVKSEKATFCVGGGIVWDSDPEKEYEETLLKSKALASAISMQKGVV
jgi:aminodeoxychorismate synthase component I